MSDASNGVVGQMHRDVREAGDPTSSIKTLLHSITGHIMFLVNANAGRHEFEDFARQVRAEKDKLTDACLIMPGGVAAAPSTDITPIMDVLAKLQSCAEAGAESDAEIMAKLDGIAGEMALTNNPGIATSAHDPVPSTADGGEPQQQTQQTGEQAKTT